MIIENKRFLTTQDVMEMLDVSLSYVEYIKQPIREAYNQLFGEAIAEYNAKQKRKDRQVTDYLKDIKNSGNGEKQFYEIVVQIRKKDDTGVLDADGNLSVDAKVASEILDQYARRFQERNPNLYLFNAVLNMDEATPHLHLDYIPVAHEYKTKMHTRNSLTKALQEMGIAPATGQKNNETVHWQAREREYLTELCKEHEIEIEILGVDRDSYSIPEYKQAMREKENAEAGIEILHSEKIEIEEALSQIGEQLENGKKKSKTKKRFLKKSIQKSQRLKNVLNQRLRLWIKSFLPENLLKRKSKKSRQKHQRFLIFLAEKRW